MDVQSNIVLPADLLTRANADRLNIAERIKLRLANRTAELFPNSDIFLEETQQGVTLPALFVRIYDQAKQRMTVYTARYAFSFDIAYLPEDESSDTELEGAAFTLLQNLTGIQEAAVQSMESSITDRVAHVRGNIAAYEEDVYEDPIIEKADKDVEVKPPEEMIHHGEGVVE